MVLWSRYSAKTKQAAAKHRGLKKNSSGPVPNVLAAMETVLDRRDTEFFFLGGEQRRLIAKGDFERGHASSGADPGV